MATIAQQLAQLAQIKADIKAAIEAKGVTVGDASFDDYDTLIASISGGGGDDLGKLIDRSITSVTIPSGVTSIGHSAFRACTLMTSISIPNTVTSIGDYAFTGCSKIEQISIPSSVTSIGQYAFNGCSKLISLAFPSSASISSSGYVCTNCSKLETVTLPTNLTAIGQNFFQNCPMLASIDIPGTVTTIGANVFSSCNIMNTIICRASTPPTVATSSFGSSSSNYAGRSAAGTKTLYVPNGKTSAYTGATGTAWVDVLLNSSKCNFTIAELDANGNIPT